MLGHHASSFRLQHVPVDYSCKNRLKKRRFYYPPKLRHFAVTILTVKEGGKCILYKWFLPSRSVFVAMIWNSHASEMCLLLSQIRIKVGSSLMLQTLRQMHLLIRGPVS